MTIGDTPLDTLHILTAFIAITIFYYLFGNAKSKPALDPVNFTPLPLVKKENISHDVVRFTFGLPNGPTGKLGLPVGQHITLKFTETLADGSTKNHQRSYTPTTGDDTPGTVTFVIKVYKANVHPKFPEGGKMSQHLDSLQIGDTVDMRGPKGKFLYSYCLLVYNMWLCSGLYCIMYYMTQHPMINHSGHMTYRKNGKFTVHPILKKNPDEERSAKHFGMIAGGTGITPMLQIMHAVLRDEPNSNVTISLLYANQAEDDILVREELEDAVKTYNGRFKLHYTLDRPPNGWKYSTGFISKEMIEEHLPSPAADGSTQILMCGPPPMVKFACLPNLEALGFKKSDHFVF